MKNYSMRAVLAMLLCLALVFSFAGCQNSQGGTAPEKETVDQKPQQTEPATSPAETGTKEPDPTENTPVDASVQIVDAYSDAITCNGLTFCYHIPEIVSEDGRYEIVNARFYERFHEMLLQNVYDSVKQYEFPLFSRMAYTWGVKGDVISVVIQTTSFMDSGKDYYVYHISAKTGELVENTELFLAFGTGEKGFLALAKSAVEAYWDRQMADVDPGAVSPDYLQTLKDKSLAEENLKAAIPCINAEGELCFVVKIFSPAGADYYWTLLNTTNGAVEELPACSVEHPVEEVTLQVTDAYADAVTYADQTLCYHIPQIVAGDDRFEIANARFYERFHQMLLQEVYYHIQHDASPSLSAMTYTWGIKGDVISVLIETSAYEYPGKDYYVYHISAKTGEPVEYTELFLAFNTGEKGFLALTKSAVEAYWNRRVSEMDPEVVSGSALQPYIDNSLAEDNLKAAIPYINAEGELCFVVKIFSPAGADYYWTLLNTADGAVEELPDCSMEHTAD